MPKLNTVYDIGAAFEAIENELISSMIRNMRRHKHSRKTTGGWLVYDVIGYQRLY